MKVQVQLSEADIEQAVRAHLVSQGLDLPVSKIELSQTRNPAGYKVEVEVGEIGATQPAEETSASSGPNKRGSSPARPSRGKASAPKPASEPKPDPDEPEEPASDNAEDAPEPDAATSEQADDGEATAEAQHKAPPPAKKGNSLFGGGN